MVEHLEQLRSRMDIVGSLPPELLIQVVEYLDPADIVRAQGVLIVHASLFTRHMN